VADPTANRPSDSAPALLRTAFYVGGYEAVGGIEAFLFDLLTSLPPGGDRSMFAWAQNLAEFSVIERAGTRVFRTSLRSGCRFGLPDALLFARHGRRLKQVDRIVFAKIPPRAIFEKIVRTARARRPRATELVYVTPYRPREMWPEGPMPDYLAQGLDRILVQSSEFTRDLREMGFAGAIDLVPYVPPVAATDPVEEPRADRRFRLGFLGRFVPQKNLFYLLDIVEALRASAIELHMFGGGDHDAALRDEARKRDLPVIFHGVAPRDAVPGAIDSCDAFINPSVSEGQCLVALEVLSRGRPFIATPVGAIPEILAKGKLGVILPLDDVPGAAAVIRDFLGAWNAGGWRAGDVAAAYSSAYSRAEIIGDYEKLL
jgi:glycosyltransferase involved in cell wall biosynthesis